MTAWGSVGWAGGTEKASYERLLAGDPSWKVAKEMADGFGATADCGERQFPCQLYRAFGAVEEGSGARGDASSSPRNIGYAQRAVESGIC